MTDDERYQTEIKVRKQMLEPLYEYLCTFDDSSDALNSASIVLCAIVGAFYEEHVKEEYLREAIAGFCDSLKSVSQSRYECIVGMQ